MESTTVEMPTIGTYEDVAQYLKLQKSTVYRMTCRKEFRPGIYIGQGRFNMSRLAECIQNGTHLQKQWKRK